MNAPGGINESSALNLGQPDYPSPIRAWMLVALLLLAGVVSAVDRGVLNMVVDPVRRDLNVSDIQISLVQGFAFGLFYASAGVPLGLIVDRVNRCRLLAAAIFIWSAATVTSGLSTSYGHLFVSRMVMGLGEATLGPCSLSLIADMFPARRRGLPISLHMLGGAIAGGVGVKLVAWILTQGPLGTFDHLPGVAGLAPWRMAFIFTGVGGVIVGLLLLTQIEPIRRGVGRKLDFRGTLTYLSENRDVFLPFYGAFMVLAVAAHASFSWTATLLMRGFGLTHGQVGNILGSAFLIAGAFGALFGGLIIDMKARTWGPLGKIKLLAFMPIVCLPAALAVLTHNPIVGAIMLAAPSMVFPMVTVVVLSVLSEFTPNNMRGLSVTFLGVVSSFVGVTVGPLLVATLTEHVLHDPKKIGWAMMMVITPALLVGTAIYLYSVGALRRSIARGSTLSQVMLPDRDG